MPSIEKISAARWIKSALVLAGTAYLVLFHSNFQNITSPQLNLLDLVLLGLAGAAWLAWRAARRVPFPRTCLDLALLLGVAAYVLTTILSTDPRRSLTVLPQILVPIFIYYLVVDLLRSGWSSGWFTQALVWASIPVIAYGVVQLVFYWVFWLQIGDQASIIPPTFFRFPSIFDHANILAGYLNLMLPIGLVGMLWGGFRRASIRYALWAILIFGLIFFTSSRGGWLGTAAILAGLAACVALTQAHKLSGWLARARQQPAWIGAIAIGLLVVAALLFAAGYRVLSHPSHGSIFSLNRESIWGPAIQAFLADPLSGLGPYTYGLMYLANVSVPPISPMPHAHSLVFNLLSESGLIGAAALLFLLIQIMRGITSQWRSGSSRQRPVLIIAGTAMLGFCVHSLFDYFNDLVLFNTILAIYAALVTAFDAQAATRPAPGETSTNRRGSLPPILRQVPALALFLAGLSGLAWGLWAYTPYAAGVQAGSRGDWAAAANYLDQAVSRDERLSINWFQSGLAHGFLALTENGDLQDADEASTAIQAYQTGLSLDPSHSVNWANLARLYWAAGEQDKAVETMRRAVELAPQAYRFWLELGRMYEQTGENTLATDCYTKSLETEPPLADLVFFKETKPRSNALERWQATLPSPEPSIYTQGWEAFSTGNFEESAVLFEQIASWRSTDVYLGLGLSYLHTDRLDEAKIALQKASFLSGENVRLSLRAHLGLHQVAVAQNDQQMAIQEGDVVLQIIEATTASGLGGINLNRVARMYFRRDALSPELLPGFIPIYGTQEVVAGLDQMGEFFEQNGQEHDVDRIEALKILAAPQY